MGLLDSVLGGLLGGNQQNSPMAGVLGNMLGGAGGVGGLVQQFEGAGLGHIAQSWVGDGPNHPVSPDQLQNVFGQQQISNWAGQAGMQQGDFLSMLAQHLPNAVDQMTSGGQAGTNDGPVSV